MQGGVVPFRGAGADALRYVEADRSRADDYYLSDSARIQYSVLDGRGEASSVRALAADEYAGWVDWINPDTGESMGRPRLAGADRLGSPRFMEMTVNAPKSLSIAAALHPEVSAALDAAQQVALAEIQRWLGQHSVTRVGSRGKQEVVPIEQMQVVGITHRTSRAGDPHRHIHMQVGTRVWAAGKWRALDTGALFKQQGAIRALGTAVIAANPELAAVLDRHGLTLDPVTGEAAELAPFNQLMSKRGEQVAKNLERFEAEWEAAHPDETMGPVVSSRLRAQAWAHERPAKKPTTLREEDAWLTELREAGYDPGTLSRRPVNAPVSLEDLSVQEVASRALDRSAAAASTWTPHTVQEHVTRITTEYGVQATPAQLREFIDLATGLATGDCFSVLPPGTGQPEHVAHLTSVQVVAAETALRDQLTKSTPKREPKHPDVTEAAEAAGLDTGQTLAAGAVASTDPLVVVEGAAGSGKTTMLGVAIEVAREHGRASRVVAPTKRAAEVAHQELGVPATSVAALVYAHGWRWSKDGVWTRLNPGDTAPDTGNIYGGPPRDAVLARGERVIVDEAGMLDQDTAHALLTVTAEAGASVALIGDRAQLPAVGRGGVLDMAAQIRGRTYDMTELHRFTDPEYAALTLAMRDRSDPGDVFDRLAGMRLITLHADEDAAREFITAHTHDSEAITVATNDEAAGLNERIRAGRVERGDVDDAVTATGSDGLSIGAGDVIQTRRNDRDLGVANRQQWIVQRVTDEGTVYAREVGNDRKHLRSVALPAEYVAEWAHLSYAAPAYGVQGATVDASHTVLSEATSAAGVYVGMTRGRKHNRLHVVAEDMADAKAQFVAAMERDRADRGLADATARAVEAVRGLVDEGPVQVVNDEIAALTSRADQAEVQAARWRQVAVSLADLRTQEVAERETARAVVQEAAERVEQVRAEVAAPLITAARAALTNWRTAETQERDTRDQMDTAGWFSKRRARTEHEQAQTRASNARAQLTDTWGAPPRFGEHADAWVERVTGPRIDNDPRVTEAEGEHRAARESVTRTPEQMQTARLAVYARMFGTTTALNNQQTGLMQGWVTTDLARLSRAWKDCHYAQAIPQRVPRRCRLRCPEQG